MIGTKDCSFDSIFYLFIILLKKYAPIGLCQFNLMLPGDFQKIESQNGQTIEAPSTFKVTTTNFSTQLGHLVNPLIKLI